jgi:hypothetical protein
MGPKTKCRDMSVDQTSTLVFYSWRDDEAYGV